VGIHFRFKTSFYKALEIPDASTQRELVRKGTSVQLVDCNKCPDPSPTEKVSTCKRCAQVDDLLHQVSELWETVKRLCSIKQAKTEIDKWFQNHAPMVDTAKHEAPWILATHKSRTLLQSPPSSTTTKTRYGALTVVDTHEQGLQRETLPATQSG